MEYDFLFSTDLPSVFIVITDEDSYANLYNRLTAAYKHAIIRMIRGKKSATSIDFFNEISAALQFPYYFGENGAALNDCITDLEWLPGEAYLLMFNNCEKFLHDASDDQFKGVLEILTDAREQWLTPNKYFPRNRHPTPFNLLFQCSGADAQFIERIRNTGTSYKQLD